jgi:competence protein ComEA
MKLRLSPAQERGLIILIGLGLAASGIAIFLFGTDHGPAPVEKPIDITGVRVILPTFVDPAQVDTVNLNTAAKEELVSLPGIGPVLAGRIIAYREKNGPFAEIEGLKKVDGIGEAVVREIRGKVRLED